MVRFDKNKIKSLEKIYRLNLINSCTGYKSANLLGSIDSEGNTNLAIFSSITHLGSDPAMIGFVLRPRTVPRNTYNNMFNTKYFTVNHVKLRILKMLITHLLNIQKKSQNLKKQNLSLNILTVLKLLL